MSTQVAEGKLEETYESLETCRELSTKTGDVICTKFKEK